MPHTISFIGGGNMARSLIGGLIARGRDPKRMVVADPMQAQLDSLHQQFGVRGTTNNLEAATGADVIVLAVKPQEMRNVTTSLLPALKNRPLIISVAAGIRAADIHRWSDGAPIVRCMPNRPALQGCGMTGLFATTDVSPEHRRVAAELLSAVGRTIWVEQEAQMDIVTAVSGSGPAYFFLLIEMLETAGIQLGLPPDVSRQLAVETAYGSGRMAQESPESPAVLRQQVTSKGGTTDAALRVLEAENVRAIFAAAIAAAARRSAELADEFGGTDKT
ncbi:pyrroline-5-carboxylate reductase [Povalibacter uvarum]|uniref:Pyrroline-5-carboxylate reductase n=1 Tax=Povalibacter uvarum TaxID=732238 RepID=A0A841HNR7_9GAMM|nr:pyrroline-5-carboxylate reductase [Povalibacter uvarum]MBB6094777.1 pyrroline-5-carboxylate reductase [Povalibacter uvarum]